MEHKHLQLLMRSQSGEYSLEQKGLILKIMTALESEYGTEVTTRIIPSHVT